MKRTAFLFTLILALGLSFTAQDAEARRLGGGMSSGMKRDSSITQRSATPAPSPAAPAQNMAQRPAQAGAPAAATPQRSGMSRWLGPLAGLAAGIGLAALFSHLGLGAEMGSFVMMLLIGVAIFLAIRFFMRRNASTAPRMQPAGAYGGGNVQRFEPLTMPAGGASAAPSPAASNANAANAAHIPAGFDADGFLRQAKLNFIRLQAANDAGNMDDIRAFTAPEMFAEIQMQYRERGQARQETDVMQLDAALLDVTDEAPRQIASVRFSGTIREATDAAPQAFDEVWHLTRPIDGSSGWVIAGIEQMN